MIERRLYTSFYHHILVLRWWWLAVTAMYIFHKLQYMYMSVQTLILTILQNNIHKKICQYNINNIRQKRKNMIIVLMVQAISNHNNKNKNNKNSNSNSSIMINIPIVADIYIITNMYSRMMTIFSHFLRQMLMNFLKY